MTKKIIVRIAEGLGNQLFMYSNAYALSKKINYELFIDDESGFFKKKNIRYFQLNNFNILSGTATNELKFNSLQKDLKRKILIIFDKFNVKKKFIIEKYNIDKKTKYFPYNLSNLSNLIYLEGNFESEKYFKEFSTDLKSQFVIKNDKIDTNNKFIDLLKKNNSVSICIRQHRYSERGNKDIVKSNKFTKETINYINKSVFFFQNKIFNPKFFIWSNDFTNLNNYFNQKDFTFVINDKNKSLNDFNLFKYSKHFIVGPSTFHWWGAWLNTNPEKICLRPHGELNPSNNKDFWPDEWLNI